MAIVVNINNGADFEPVSEGVHAAVLADVVDLGVQETAFGPKEKVQLIWLSDEPDENGKTKYLFKRYTKSLHEKSSLRKDVKALRDGRDIDTSSFDLETLIGTTNQLVVQHSEANNGKVYANVIGIMKGKGPKLAVPADFTRRKDKAPSDFNKKQPSPARAVASAGGGRAAAAAVLSPVQPISDDDIPF